MGIWGEMGYEAFISSYVVCPQIRGPQATGTNQEEEAWLEPGPQRQSVPLFRDGCGGTLGDAGSGPPF